MKQESITIISNRMKKKIRIADILYIIKSEYLSLIHLIDGDILQTITPIYELKEMLGDDCIEVKKGCIVSVSAITNIKEKIYLCNGEAIDFTARRRKAVRLEWREKQKLMIDEINRQNPPRTDEEYSPEIDANLRILCFPTFPGHCGCILRDMDRLRFMKNENWLQMAAVQKSRDF